MELGMRLTPKETMGFDEQCWCNSGELWVNCHKKRETLKKYSPLEQKRIQQKRLKQGFCLHPYAGTECNKSKVTKTHTIQKNGALKAIANKKNKVLSVLEGAIRYQYGHTPLELFYKGIRSEASIFPGFCNRHDTELFRPIELKSVDIDGNHAFLFAFRALSYEINRRTQLIKGFEDAHIFDAGHDYDYQAKWQEVVQIAIEQCSIVLQRLKAWKKEYDQLFRDGECQSSYYLVEFDQLLPFVACGAFMPEMDFHMRRYFVPDNPEFVSVNMTSYAGLSKLILCFHGERGGPADSFVQSFAELDDADKANTALHLCVQQLENVYFDPVWWNRLNKEDRDDLTAKMVIGTPKDPNRGPRPIDSFVDLKHILKAKLAKKPVYFYK